MEPYMIDYYNDFPHSVNVIEKMNNELQILQHKYDKLKSIIVPSKILRNLVRAALSDDGMANLLFHLYGDKFKCTSIKKNEWYFYDDDIDKWRLSDEGVELRYLLNTEVTCIFKNEADIFMKKYDGRRTPYEKGKDETQCSEDWVRDIELGERFFHQYIKLKKPFTKRAIMKECRWVFYDKDFIVNNLKNIEDLSVYQKYDPYGMLFK